MTDSNYNPLLVETEDEGGNQPDTYSNPSLQGISGTTNPIEQFKQDLDSRVGEMFHKHNKNNFENDIYNVKVQSQSPEETSISAEQLAQAREWAKDNSVLEVYLGLREPQRQRAASHARSMEEFIKRHPSLLAFFQEPTNRILTREDIPALMHVMDATKVYRASVKAKNWVEQFTGFTDKLSLSKDTFFDTVKQSVGDFVMDHTKRPAYLNTGQIWQESVIPAVKEEMQQLEDNLSPERKEKLAALDLTTHEGQVERREILKDQINEDHGFNDELEALYARANERERERMFLNLMTDEKTASRYLPMIAQGTVEMVPAILTGIVTKSPNLSLAMMSSFAYGHRVEQAVNRGASWDAAQREGVVFAVLEGVTEKLPVEAFLKTTKGRTDAGNFLSRLFDNVPKSAGLEGVQEVIMEGLDIGYGIGILDEDITWSEAVSRLIDAGIIGTGVGFNIRTGVNLPNAVFGWDIRINNENALKDKEDLGNLNQAVNETQTIANSKDTVKEMLDDVITAEDGVDGDGTVLVDAQDLLDLEQDLYTEDESINTAENAAGQQTFTENLNVDINELKEAATAGGDISIKASDILTLDTESFNRIAPSIRRDIESPTPKEAQQALDEREEKIEQIKTELDKQEEEQFISQPIYDVVFNELTVGQGRTVEEAHAAAQLWQSRYETRAANMEGVTALDLFLQDNVKIKNPMQAKTDKALSNKIITEALEQADTIEEDSDTTQSATTAGSYLKAVAFAATILNNKKIHRILDYGAGLGYGAAAIRVAGAGIKKLKGLAAPISKAIKSNKGLLKTISERTGARFVVKEMEPNQERRKAMKINKPHYGDPQSVEGKYDLILNLSVLNVVPNNDGQRNRIVDDIIEKISENGVAIITTRKWENDVSLAAKGAEKGDEKNSIIITKTKKGEKVKVFQKGFSQKELQDYIESRLPEGYIVEAIPAAAKISGAGVLIRRIPRDAQKVEKDMIGPLNNALEQSEETASIPALDGTDIDIAVGGDELELATGKKVKRLTIRDLIGLKILPIIADRTAVGLYTGTDENKLDVKIPLLGGPFFPLRIGNIIKNIIWANRGEGMVGRQRRAVEELGVTHILVTLGEKNMHMSNVTVSTSFIQLLLQRVKDGSIPKKTLLELQKSIRETKVQLKTPEQIEAAYKKDMQKAKSKGAEAEAETKKSNAYKTLRENKKTIANYKKFPSLTGDPKKVLDWLHKISFTHRKNFMKKMELRSTQSKTGINVQKLLNDTRQAETNLNNLGDGIMLLKIATKQDEEGKTTADLMEIDHPDFPYGIKGELVGVFDTPISYKALFQDFLAQKRKEHQEKIDRGEKKKGARHGAYYQWQLAPPILEVTEELADKIGEIETDVVDGPLEAQMVADLINDNFSRSDKLETEGGIKGKAWRDAVEINTDGFSAIEYVQSGKQGFNNRFNAGELILSGLGKAHAYSLIEVINGEKQLVGLINNEQGAKGIAYTSLVLDALEQGVTSVHESVETSAPEVYNFLVGLGFRTKNGKLQYDHSEKKDGESYKQRYINGGLESLQPARTRENVEDSAEDLADRNSREFGRGGRTIDLQTAGGLKGPLRESSLASRARAIAVGLTKLTDAQLNNLQLEPADRLNALALLDKPLALHQEGAGATTHETVKAILDGQALITDDILLAVLGDFPNYLIPVANFMAEQQRKLTSGTLTIKDLIKAHAITVGSQMASAVSVKKFFEKTGFNPNPLFLSGGKIRPEEAVAMWFGTEKGQRALADLEQGIYDPETWQELYDWRNVFGLGKTLKERMEKDLTQEGMTNLNTLLEELNELGKKAGKGNNVVSDIEKTAKKLSGVAEAKGAFLMHLLGMGNVTTMDAVQINFWLTGKGDIRQLDAKDKRIVSQVKQSAKGKVMLRELVMSRFESLKSQLDIPESINDNVFHHIMHHWLWDRAKGLETTHEGMYEAMANYQDGAGIELLPEEKLEKKYKAWGVGKRMGKKGTYIHKSAINALPKPLLNRIKKAKIPRGHKWEIIKYDETTGNISLIESPDWNTADEPISGNSFILKIDGSTRMSSRNTDPNIYHHKWLFVHDNYKGFDIAESRMRSRIWKALPDVNTSKIGKKSYWDENVVPRIAPNPLAQKETGPVGPKGTYHQEQIDKSNISNIITLLDGADKSTFLHETGHFWLFQMMKDLKDPRLTKAGKARLERQVAATKSWFKKNANQAWADIQEAAVKARKAADKDKKSMSKKVRADQLAAAVKHAKENGGVKYMRDVADNFMQGFMNHQTTLEIGFHEVWARGYESYLGEGKAPVASLSEAFANFTAFMIGVYKQLKNLRVKLSPEIRSVFDQLLATEDALAIERDNARYKIPDEIMDSATASEQEQMAELSERAAIEARNTVMNRTSEAMRREGTDKRRKQEKEIRERVTKDIISRPLYAALRMIKKGIMPDGNQNIDNEGQPRPLLINRKVFEQVFDKKTARKMPRGTLSSKVAEEESNDMEVIAKLAGFETVAEMVDALTNEHPTEANAINMEVKAAIEQELGKMMSPEEIAMAAKEAVDNDMQLEVMQVQARILERLASKPIRKVAEREVQEEGAPTAPESRAAVEEAKAEVEKAKEGEAAEAIPEQVELIHAREKQKEDIKGRKAQAGAKRKLAKLLRGINLKTIKSIAEQRILDLKIRDVNPNKFRAAADRLQKKYTKAIAGRDYRTAADLLNQMMLNIALSKAAAQHINNVTKKVTKLRTLVQKTDKKIAASMQLDLIQVVRQLAFSMDIGEQRGTNITLKEHFEKINNDVGVGDVTLNELSTLATTLELDILNLKVDNPQAKGPAYKEMKLRSFNDLMDLADRIVTEARNHKMIGEVGQKESIENITAEFIAQTDDLKKENKKKIGSRGTERQRSIKDWFATTGAFLARIEIKAREIDGNNFDGVFTKYIVTPIMKASNTYKEKSKVPIDKLVNLLKDKVDSLGKKINIVAHELVDKTGKAWQFNTKADLIAALLHMGNESNYRKLVVAGQKDIDSGNQHVFGTLDQYGVLNDAPWQAFIKRMHQEGILTKEDWDLVQGIWDIFEFTKGEAQKAHKEMYGYYFNELDNSPVITPFGIYKGGYVPAVTDRLMSMDATKNADAEILNQQQNASMFPQADIGFTKQRIEAYAEPLNLDLMQVPLQFMKVMKMAYLAPQVRAVGRLIFNRKFKRAVNAVEPDLLELAVLPWLQRTVRQQLSEASSHQGSDKTSRYLNEAVGIQTMMANVINSLQQYTGLATAALVIKAKYLAAASVSWKGKDGQRRREYITTRSLFMKERMINSQNDLMVNIDEMLTDKTKYGKARVWLVRHAYFAQQLTQNTIDPIVWLAAEAQGMENGVYKQAHEKWEHLGPEEAHARAMQTVALYADSMVRNTQSPMRPEDVSRIETGKAYMRLFIKFFSYFNNMYNLNKAEFRIAAREMGSPVDRAGRYFFIYLFGIVVPSMVAEAISMGIRGDLFDEEEWEEEHWSSLPAPVFEVAIMSQIKFATAMMPYVGNVVNFLLSPLTKEYFDDRLSISPVMSIGSSAVNNMLNYGKFLADVDNGISDTEAKHVRHLIHFFGVAFKLPTNWLGKPLSYLMSVEKGESYPEGAKDIVRGFLTGKDGTEE